MTLTIKNSPDLNSPGKPGASSPRSNPVCLEVAITIRSLPTEAGGLTQPIREEGRTVIVFDNGAVLRSTNNLPVGQTVIVSNPDGRDVVCRVVGGRNLPSIKGYVEVEFLEPVNDFWHIHEEGAPVAAAPATGVSLALRGVPTPPSPVTPSASAPVEAPVKPANKSVGSGPTFEDIPGLLTSPVSASKRELSGEAAKPGPEKAGKDAPHYDLSEIANPTSVANWRSPVADLPAEKHSSPAVKGDASANSSAPSSAHDFLSKGLMAYEQPNASSRPSSGRTPLIVGLSTLVLAFLAGVVFFAHRGSVDVAVAIPQVTSQPSAAGPRPASSAPEAARVQPEVTSPATTQSQTPNQARVQSAAVDQPQPVATVAPATAGTTPTTSTDIRMDATPVQSPAQSNVKRQEKSAIAAKQSDLPASRRPSIPNLKLGSPSAPKQKLANSGEGAAPLTDVASTDAAGGSNPSALLTSAGRISNPPAPPSALAPPPVAAPKILRDPEVISTTRPSYPASAKEANVQGIVTVTANINENGNVVSAKAMTGPILLRQAAADAVKMWKYSPRLVDGKPTPSQVTVAVEFKLK